MRQKYINILLKLKGLILKKRNFKKSHIKIQIGLLCFGLFISEYLLCNNAEAVYLKRRETDSDYMEDNKLTPPSEQFAWSNKIVICERDFSTAVTTSKLNIRSGPGTKFRILCTVQSNTKLMLTGEANTDSTWVLVKASNGVTGWCCRLYLKMDAVNTSTFQGLAKATVPLYIRVSLNDQKVSVLDSKDLVIKMFTCSSGESGSETPTGTFTVSGRGESFYNSNLGEGAYYWTRFYGNYLFHSIPFDENYQIEQDEAAKLGTPASHGCIRLSFDNARWIYDHISDGTKVIIQ